jgi:metal-responsive CopG/Arc/MetJ family transcriptional regulator
MSTAKIAISLERELLARVDRLVRTRVFPNRSQAVRSALRDKIERLERTRLARECAKADPKLEQAMAEEGLAKDMEEWPESG